MSSPGAPAEEFIPFLRENKPSCCDDTLRNEAQREEQPSKASQLRNLSIPILIHLALITVYTGVFFFFATSSRRFSDRSDLPYSPAQDSVIHESKVIKALVNDTHNVFNGPPSPALDKAWSDLFSYANVQVTEDELKRVGRSSIKLSDGSGNYLAALDVYHQIHCLKYIRHYIHPEYYELGKTNVPNKEHVNHCIDMLRQVIMCKADITLMTYSWLPDFPGPWPNFNIEHECVNWDRIQEWSKARAIDVFDPKYLRHPTLGFSYKHLKGLNLPHDD